MKRSLLIIVLALISISMLNIPLVDAAIPNVYELEVSEEYAKIDVTFRVATVGGVSITVFEEDVLIRYDLYGGLSTSLRTESWTKVVSMKNLHWSIRIIDDGGTAWINGTYEYGSELITFHGISSDNATIAFHLEATLECELTVYKDNTPIFEGEVGANFFTIAVLRNGTVGTHTYNITFIQTRFTAHEFLWQLDHEDIIVEELIVPEPVTVTVTITETVTVTTTITETVTTTITETVTVTTTVTETVIVTETEVVTITEYITIIEVQTVVIPSELGVISGVGVGAGVSILVLLALTKFREA